MKIKRIVAFIFVLVMSFSAMTYAQQGTFFVSAASDSTVSVKTPTSFKASKNKETSIRLTWKKVSDASGYRIYKYNSSDKKWEKIKTLKDTEYTVKKLTAGTVYKFRVKAYKKVDGKTLWSEATSTLKTATKPATPKELKASSVSENAIKLAWSKVNGATGYRVYKYNTETKTWEKIKTTTAKNYTVKGLQAGTTYKFRVKAYKRVSGEVMWGEATSTLKVTTTKVEETTTKKQETTTVTTKPQTTATPTGEYATINGKKYELYEKANGNLVYYDEYGLAKAYISGATGTTEIRGDECPHCGKITCIAAGSDYYCVICKKTISAHTCHSADHFGKSH